MLLVVAGLFGVPQGLASVSNQAAMYRQAPAGQLGTAAGLSRTSVYLGAIVSSAVIGVTFGAQPTDAGLHRIGWFIALATGTAAVLAFFDRSLRGPSGPARRAVPADH